MSLELISSINLWEMLSHVVSLVVAYVLALPIGWNREREERSAGIRTFPLVAMAACGFVLVAIGVLGATSPGQARILEGLITGVGFIGAGVILHDAKAKTVHGLTTAATVWIAAGLGIACALGAWLLVVAAITVTLLVLFVLGWVERRLGLK